MKRYNIIPFNLLNGIGPIFKISTVSFFPDCPPNAMWDYPPPCLLALASPSSYPTTQQVCSILRHGPIVSVKLRKMAQICLVKLQCKNRCLLVSSAFPHNEHQDTMIFPFLFNTSCVRQVFLATNHVKHFTLVLNFSTPFSTNSVDGCAACFPFCMPY